MRLTTPTALDPLRRSAAGQVAGALIALGLVTTEITARLGLGFAYPLKSLVVFLIMVGLLSPLLSLHRPHARFGPANTVTLLRLGLTASLAGLVGAPTSTLGWWIVGSALVVVTLDGVDGWLARRYRTESAFGARFDMETDALLILVLAMLAWQLDKAGPWILLAGVLRYAFVGAGHWWAWIHRPLPCSFRRKTACVLQIATLIACLTPLLHTPSSAWVAGVGLVFLCYSFWVDLRWLKRNANRIED
ncbi:MAG: CDP-alcohol phosphatidyltransferase family protein [Thiotrichales bacterium]